MLPECVFIFLGSSVYFVRTPSLSPKASFPLMFSSFASDLSLLSIEFIFVGNFRSYLYCLVYVSRLVILSFFSFSHCHCRTGCYNPIKFYLLILLFVVYNTRLVIYYFIMRCLFKWLFFLFSDTTLKFVIFFLLIIGII